MVQLTYRTQKGFVYGLKDFDIQRTFTYPGEGWALTHNGDRVYMSDGTAQIRIWDAATLEEKSRIHGARRRPGDSGCERTGMDQR